MQIRSPMEIGLLVKSRRKQLGWTQEALADRIRTSRPWVVQLESGKVTAQFGKVLAALIALGIELHVAMPSATEAAPAKKRMTKVPAIDIDAIVRRHSERPRA